MKEVQYPDDLKPEESEALKQLIAEYDDVFALTDVELGCTDRVTHKIDTGEHAPIKQHPKRIHRVEVDVLQLPL